MSEVLGMNGMAGVAWKLANDVVDGARSPGSELR